MPLDRSAIDHLALLARLELSEDEKRLFAEQLSRIVAHVEKIDELDLTGVEPMAFAIPLESVTRPDEPAPCLPREEALRAAPAATDEGFLVPSVLGGGEA